MQQYACQKITWLACTPVFLVLYGHLITANSMNYQKIAEYENNRKKRKNTSLHKANDMTKSSSMACCAQTEMS